MPQVTQPQSSYWCWAACLSKMINGLNSPTQIGNKQCDIVSYYKHQKYHKNVHQPKMNDSCCGKSGHQSPGCNIALDETDLASVFTKGGFDTYEVLSLSDLEDFDNVKKTLKRKQAPIVLKTKTGNFSHMILINGYGERDGCKYILPSDPIAAKGEKYVEFDYFKSSVSIEKAWETEVLACNLHKDKKLNDSIALIQKFIDSKIKPITQESKLLDPWNFLTSPNLPNIANYILTGNTKEISAQWMIENLTRDFDTENILTCNPYVLRDTVLLGEINFISEEELNSGSYALREKGNNQAYFDQYATRVQIKKKEEEILVKPISYPKNYLINEGWQTYEEFRAMLYNPINPKIQFFKNTEFRPFEKEAVLSN